MGLRICEMGVSTGTGVEGMMDNGVGGLQRYEGVGVEHRC